MRGPMTVPDGISPKADTEMDLIPMLAISAKKGGCCERRGAYRASRRNLREEDHLKDSGVDGKIILK